MSRRRPNLRAVVDGLVGRDRYREELPAELEHRLVLKDDCAAVLTGALNSKLVDGRDVVAGRNLWSEGRTMMLDLGECWMIVSHVSCYFQVISFIMHAISYLKQDRPRLVGAHVDVIAVHLDAVSGERGPDPHRFGFFQQRHDDLKWSLVSH